MKVAFIIPFAFEKFFHFADHLRSQSENFEDEVISKSDTWHINWCKALIKQGFEVTIYHLSLNKKNKREYMHQSGIQMKRFPSKYNGTTGNSEYSFQMLKDIKADNPDVVFSVTHIMRPIVDMYDVLSFYCYLNKMPLVTRNPHADTYSYIFPVKKESMIINHSIKSKLKSFKRYIRGELKFFIKRISLKMTDAIVPQTDVDVDNLLKYFNIQTEKVFKLPKPIDQQNFHEINKSEARVNCGLDQDCRYLMHASNLFDTKGCEHIISVLPSIRKRVGNVKLIVVGNGPKKDLLEKLAAENGVSDFVFFAGQVSHSDLLNYYNSADCFVLPTEIAVEGQPNVLIEAIACNTPAVSSNLPGPSAILKPGLGLLVDLKDISNLEEAIIKVLRNEFAIDQEKRQNLLYEYSLENVGGKLVDLFKTITIGQNRH